VGSWIIATGFDSTSTEGCYGGVLPIYRSIVYHDYTCLYIVTSGFAVHTGDPIIVISIPDSCARGCLFRISGGKPAILLEIFYDDTSNLLLRIMSGLYGLLK
jgi:hypothetical protein